VIIHQVNVVRGVGLIVVFEGQAPVSGHAHTPNAFQVAFELVQMPARDRAELVDAISRGHGVELLAEFIGHRRRNVFRVIVLPELPKTFVPKTSELHVLSLHASILYGQTVQVKEFLCGMTVHAKTPFMGFWHDFAQ
jgi:hypothetical protein